MGVARLFWVNISEVKKTTTRNESNVQPVGFPTDFAYEKLAVKVANGDHMSAGTLQHF